ncbi:MAG: dihydrolipoamide acetyltransferase family protein [Nitrospiraceae bacterium]|nr:dihydrolipoamide acetyltransferase family protein [Nitrospiraceae bacterium]
MSNFLMPSLGADMEKAKLGAWLVGPGDRVKRGQVIAEVETDKGIIEIEVYEDGVVERLVVEAGTEVPVGEVLAIMRTEGAPEAMAGAERPEKAVPAKAGERIRTSPAARKKAEELGVDFGTVTGTGPEGSITLADVERAAGTKAVPPIEGEKQVPDFAAGMRRAISAAMARSNRDIPHYYLETQIDMSRPLLWLEAENLKRAVKDRVLPVALLVKAVACALKDVPELNGYWADDRNQPQESVHVGFAISLKKGGLFVPAIHDVDKKNLGELMGAMNDLITRTRAGRLRGPEMTDATITVTNLGDLGVEAVYGVIYPPQVALVGFGRITERPWAENGMLGARPVLTATLAGDHRATDGIMGARFLGSLNRYLQEPEKL